jgi:hypothetical protein
MLSATTLDATLQMEVVMVQQNSPTPDAGKRLWESFELAHHDLEHDRLAVGRLGMELRNMYSERSNSADRRRSSGHGSFEAELRKRGYKPNRIREAIRDYRVSIGELPQSESTAAKRKARQSKVEDYPTELEALTNLYSRPHPNEPERRKHLAEFAILIPLQLAELTYKASLECYQENWRATRALEAAWSNVKGYYEEIEARAEQARKNLAKLAQDYPEDFGGPKAVTDLDNSTQVVIQ